MKKILLGMVAAFALSFVAAPVHAQAGAGTTPGAEGTEKEKGAAPEGTKKKTSKKKKKTEETTPPAGGQ
jgi:hypothetical protein